MTPEKSKKQAEQWLKDFLIASPSEKIWKLGDVAYKFTSNIVGIGLKEGEKLLKQAEEAFFDGLDETVDEATVIEEESKSQKKPST